MKEFNVIAAVALNGVIGDSQTNSIPWYLPLDLKHFKSKTMGQTVVMGTKTYRSIGKPLPNRRNVIVTRNADLAKQLINEERVDECYSSFNEVVLFERGGFFIVGGEHMYGDAIRAGATNLFITIVKIAPEGDVRFPISGERFLENTVSTSNGIKYSCVKRSAWLKENDIEFQFTEFRFNA
jgi:dihydrofolate reductase